MDFSLSDTQKQLIDSVCNFAKKELIYDVVENDRQGVFARAAWKKCCEMGLVSLPISDVYGGQGANLLTTALCFEALSRCCRDSGLVHALVTQTLCALQIALYGNDYQKATFIPSVCRGEIVCSQAITEPNAGSDVSAIRLKAIKGNDAYVLNGSKMFITNGPIAELVILLAVTNPSTTGFGRASFFLVETAVNGVSKGKPLEKLGLRTLQNCELVFTDCSIPASAILGKEGQGVVIFNETMLFERILLSSCHLGTIHRILDTCVQYAKDREQFGRPIAKFQSISHKISKMKLNLELGALIIQKAAWLKDQGKRPQIEASIAKLFISECLKRTCLDAVQIHGGYGFMSEFQIERDLRDSIASTIYSGTSEIQNNIISTLLGL